MPPARAGGLERSCRLRLGTGAAGIERLAAHVHGPAFSPHRHDTYAVGITLSGVQSFRFRGRQWHGLPGQCHILHPDETHDGAAGTEAGFSYRIVYIDPGLVQEALAGQPLPFVADPVVGAERLGRMRTAAIWDIDGEIDDIGRTDLVSAVVDLLLDASGQRRKPAAALGLGRLRRVRELLAAAPAERRPMNDLERMSGLDRWTLARQFRAAFGTSPGRFRTMRQLDEVRGLLARGAPLADAAAAAGFADQSHMTRRFKAAYGLTPGAWLAATG